MKGWLMDGDWPLNEHPLVEGVAEDGAAQPFEQLDVWRRAARLSSDIDRGLKDLRDGGFRDQITRAGLSIPSDIAEGDERETNKDFIKFLHDAKGSAGELRTQIDIGIEALIITPASFLGARASGLRAGGTPALPGRAPGGIMIEAAAMKGVGRVRQRLERTPLPDILLSPVVLGELELGVEKSAYREKTPLVSPSSLRLLNWCLHS